MGTKAAEKGKNQSNWRYISIVGLVLIGMLAVAWASVGSANAATPSPAATTGKQGQAQGAQPQSPLRLPILGPNAGQPQTGSGQSTSAGKGQPASQHKGSSLEAGLPELVGHSGRPAEAGTAAPSDLRPAFAPAASPTCAPEWSVVPTRNQTLHSNILLATTEVGPNDVWAGGYYGSDASTSENLPFFEHWNGSSWSAVAAAFPASIVSGQIWDISANSSGDVWAVGYYSDGTNTFELIEQWNGLQWNAITGAKPSATDNELYGVAAVSTNNVWAVGYYNNGTLKQTLIEHWNGTTWAQASSPNHGTGANELQDISMVSGSDMWAVGVYYPTPADPEQTLALHYNGSTWSYVVSPDQGAGDNVLTGVHAISTSDAWAVGTDTVSNHQHTLAEHWNGSTWTIMPTINPDPTIDIFERVFATASNDVWAVGATEDAGNIPTQLIEHWNGTTWSVSTNSPVGAAGLVIGITGSSSSDLWAIGAYLATSTSTAQTLTEHNNGTSWNVVYSPDAPSGSNILYSVSAVSATDIWAVGYASGYVGGTSTSLGVIEHWNGATWSLVTSFHPTTYGDQLFSVKAVSANDVWAVGNYDNATNEQTFIEHWNGSTWTQVSSPNPGGSTNSNALIGVDAASANDVWAVGDYNNGTATQTLALHWGGSSWLQVPSPNPGAYSDLLSDVTVVPGSGGSNVWAVGDYQDLSTDKDSSLLEQWNGSTWSVASSPNVSGVDNEPVRIFAQAANDVWAVGLTSDASSFLQNLVLHWNGTSWAMSPIVQQGSGSNELVDVTSIAPNDAYAVGAYTNVSSQPQALMEHWNGSAWSVVPSIPSPSLGAAIAGIVAVSSSNMWAVGAYLPEGFDGTQTLAEHYFPCLTSCTITFSDVPVGSTFYPYIHCLACLGIINGYPDGTFKPNANVTRGQLSKIVANSAGFSDAQPDQMFQDVPVGSTFQPFVGRLASRGYISGYTCGGVGEPCVPPGNLPYFRPNANATRGQISKIDSNSAGFSDTPSGQQFQDVPANSTYYPYIYRLVSRSIMSGYACGHPPAGACVPPGNLPYFVPNNNATRGQTAKIVSGTFFPDCSSLDAVMP